MKIKALALAAAAAFSAAAAPAQTTEAFDNKELAKALEGRVAGEPVRCLNTSDIRSSRIIDGVGILYRVGASKLYLNIPRAGAESLDSWDILLTEVRGGSICSRESVKLLDSSSRMLSGFVFLGDFVPYTKASN